MNTTQNTAVSQAVNFAAAGFAPYTNIVEALAKTLGITGDAAAELMADEVLARMAAEQ